MLSTSHVVLTGAVCIAKPSFSALRLPVASASSAVTFGPVESGATGEEDGERSGGRGGEGEASGEEGGEGGAGGEGGGGQQSAEPQPASKQDCWQYGPPLTSSIHPCFEQALSNNRPTPRTDCQSLHLAFLPPALPIDPGALSSHITHGKGVGDEGGGSRQQLSLTTEHVCWQ